MRRLRWAPSIDRARVTALVLAVGGIAGDVVANVAGDDPGLVTWAVVAVALGAVIVLTVVDARLGEGPDEPERAVATEHPGVVTDLPRTTRFAGREREVARITAALGPAPVVVVAGRRGIGTSSCAVQAANEVRGAEPDRFADGQAYLDLRTGRRSMSAYRLLTAVAAKVGVDRPVSAGRDHLAAAAGRIRAALEGSRILLVLDDADDPAQVEPLLPLPDGCRVIVAGGPRLGTLGHGAQLVALGEPDTREAVDMCAAAAAAFATGGGGTRPRELRGDPAADELVELCGRQPWALGVLGYEIARQGWPVRDLTDAFRRVVAARPHEDVRCDDPLVLVAAGDVAYRALSRPARRLYRLLALVGEPVDRATLAALRGPSLRRLRGLRRPLDELIDGGFVVGDGHRHRVRPVLVANARLHLRLDEPARRRVRARTRMIRMLTRRAEHHAPRLVPATRTGRAGRAGRAGRGPGSPGLSLDGDPWAWFETNHRLLHWLVVAESAGPSAGRWWFRLAQALCVWLERTGRTDDRVTVCQAALAAPAGRDRARVAGWARTELGTIERRRGHRDEARRQLTLALAQGGHRGRAQRHTDLGLVLLDLGQVEQAIDHLRLAGQHRTRSDRVGSATTDLALGVAYLRWGALDDACAALQRATDTFRAVGQAGGEAAALSDLGLAQWALGRRPDALESWSEAVRLSDPAAHPGVRAAALLNLGAALLHVDPAQAAEAHRMLAESQALRAGLPSTSATSAAGGGRTLLHRGRALALLGEDRAARACWEVAEVVCGDGGDHEAAAAAADLLAELRS